MNEPDFVSDLFHAWNQPLTKLRCGLEVALLQERSSLEYRAVLQQALEHADQAARLASGIREWTEAAAPSETWQWIELDAVLADTVHDLSPVAESLGSKLTLQCDSGLRILAQPRHLCRALLYLLDWLLQAICPGTEIVIRAAPDRRTVHLQISSLSPPDTPTKLPDNQSPHTALTRHLGLAIAQRILAAAGGKWKLETRRGNVDIWIRLPLARENKMAVHAG